MNGWQTPEEARHSFRILCDDEGVSYANKNKLCRVVRAESGFDNNAKNVNRRKDGSVGSTDWGIFQVNDRFHIGPSSDFPSVQYVLDHPDVVARWMIKIFRQGHLDWWCAFSNGSYLAYAP